MNSFSKLGIAALALSTSCTQISEEELAGCGVLLEANIQDTSLAISGDISECLGQIEDAGKELDFELAFDSINGEELRHLGTFPEPTLEGEFEQTIDLKEWLGDELAERSPSEVTTNFWFSENLDCDLEPGDEPEWAFENDCPVGESYRVEFSTFIVECDEACEIAEIR